MVTIRNITEKKKAIYLDLDTGENLAIPLPLAAQYRLTQGKVLETDEYRQIRAESERYFCSQKALDYLSVKNRTSFEIRKYLMKKGFSADIIAEVVLKLEESGLIDDMKYALSYTRLRREAKPVGKNLIRNELQRKGLPRATIRKAIEESGISNDIIEEVLSLARKKLNSLKGKKNAYRKVGYFLTQRGFDYETIHRVMAQLKNEEPDNEGAHNA